MVRLILLLLLTTKAYSTPTPEFLKGGEVKVTTKQGKDFKFSSDEWFVANREESARYHAKLKKRMQDLKDQIALLKSPEAPLKRHRLTFHLGYGLTGVNLKRFSNGVDVFQEPGPIGGLSYSYSFTDRYSISFTGLTSVAGMVGFGLNW